jgi:anti-sigma B factor antagonist
MDITSPLEAVVATRGTGAGAADEAQITLRGRIDRDADVAMSDAYREAAALGSPVIHVDFSGVDYINSTGIALIVRLLADARRDHREIRASGLSEHYREIFRITRLADYMTLIDDETTTQGGPA